MTVLKFKALFTLGLWATGLLSASATPDLSEYETEDDSRVPIPRSVVSTHAEAFSAHVTAAYPLIHFGKWVPLGRKGWIPGRPLLPRESRLYLPTWQIHADDADTQVVIVTPWLPGETNIKYPNQVSQIKKHIEKLLPNAAEPRIRGYFNIGQSDALIDNERFVDNGKFTGKVLLNFDPASKTKMHSTGNLEL